MLHDKTAIEAAIKDAGGNISDAARKLGVARRTLQSRMRFFGLPEGRAGRRKMRISYGKRRKLYTAGALAAGALVAVAVLRRRGTPA
jgi:transposase-like protein